MGDGGMDGDRDLWDRLGAGGFGTDTERRQNRDEGRGRRLKLLAFLFICPSAGLVLTHAATGHGTCTFSILGNIFAEQNHLILCTSVQIGSSCYHNHHEQLLFGAAVTIIIASSYYSEQLLP
jgi:hypothetical protein